MTNASRVFLIGGSAGAIEATRDLLAQLPSDFPCSVLVVIHTAPQSPGLLSKVLQRRAKMVVRTAEERMKLEPGHVYVAPPDRHLTVKDGVVRLRTGPVENRHRPAIDSLFRSAASALGPRAVGIILSGYLDDGCAGLYLIRQSGGVAIVQNPEDAIAPDMPFNAIERVQPDYTLSIREIAGVMQRLASEPVVRPEGAEVAYIDDACESSSGNRSIYLSGMPRQPMGDRRWAKLEIQVPYRTFVHRRHDVGRSECRRRKGPLGRTPGPGRERGIVHPPRHPRAH